MPEDDCLLQTLCLMDSFSHIVDPFHFGAACVPSAVAVLPVPCLFVAAAAGVPVWAFESCPTESECTNGHHTCDEMTEDCYDTFTAFRCECKQGYIRNVK